MEAARPRAAGTREGAQISRLEGEPAPNETSLAPEDGRHYRPVKSEMPRGHVQKITVPIMGEGIRNAKIVSLLKKPGDPIALDDDLCEVETDKAVYPIQSSFAGTMGEWKTKVGDTVDIGQELGTILTGEVTADGAVEAVAAATTKPEKISHEDTRRHRGVEPALSPTITRKLSRVIPANL